VGGFWRPVSWDEAVGGVAADLAAVAEAGGPGALAVYAGRSAGTAASRAVAFGRTLGSGRVFAWREADEAAFASAAQRVLGHPVRLVPDPERAVHVLRIGAAPGHPGPLRSCPDPGCGPRRSLTIAHPRPGEARTRLALRPGSEVFLVLGLAGAILARGWGDAQYLRDHARGGEAAAGALESWTPERCAARCGVPPDDLLAEALRFARAPMAVALTDSAIFRTPAGSLLAWSLLLLHAATANLLRPGGLYAPPPSPGARTPGPLGRRIRSWATRRLPPVQVVGSPLALLGPPSSPRALLAAGGLPTDDYGPAVAPLLDHLDLIVLIGTPVGDPHPRARWILPSAREPGGRPTEDVLGAILEHLLGGGGGPGPGWRLACNEASVLLQGGSRRLRERVLSPRPAPGAQADRARWDVAHADGRLHLDPPPALCDLSDAPSDPALPLDLFAGEPEAAPGSLPSARIHPSSGHADGARVSIVTPSGSFEARIRWDTDLRRDAVEVSPLPRQAGDLDALDSATGEPWRHGVPCHILARPTRNRKRSRP